MTKQERKEVLAELAAGTGIVFAILAVIFLLATLTGCTTTGVKVTRTAPDGSSVSVEQKSKVVIKGDMEAVANALSLEYEATTADGSTVSLNGETGHNAEGMSADTPIGDMVALLNSIAELRAALLGLPVVAE